MFLKVIAGLFHIEITRYFKTIPSMSKFLGHLKAVNVSSKYKNLVLLEILITHQLVCSDITVQRSIPFLKFIMCL